MTYTQYATESGKLRPQLIMRCAADGKGSRRCLSTIDLGPLGRAEHEMIAIGNYVYLRESKGDWRALSKRTYEAVYGKNSDGVLRNLSEQADKAVKDLLANDNMKQLTIETVHGRKTRVYGSVNPAKIADDDDLALLSAKTWVTIADGRLRKFQLDFLNPRTNTIEAVVVCQFYAFNSPIVLNPPKLSGVSRNPNENNLFLDYAMCRSHPDRTCQENELTITWDARHVKNAVAVVLTREGQKGQLAVTLPTLGQLNGSLSQQLCGAATYRIVGINRKGRPLLKTTNYLPVTQGNLLPCE